MLLVRDDYPPSRLDHGPEEAPPWEPAITPSPHSPPNHARLSSAYLPSECSSSS